MPAFDEYPNLQAALQGPVIDLLRGYWVQLAIPHSQTGHYVRGLFGAESVEYPFEGHSLAVSLKNLAAYAYWLEEGHAEFHLPSRIRNWPHHTKDGRGYMRVPFRHMTPGNQSASMRAERAMMPKAVYEAAKNLNDYRRRQNPYRLTGNPNLAANRKYFFMENMPGKMKAAHSASIYEGMIRNVQENRGAKSSVFTTFRTVTEDSPGWIIPAVPGQHFTRQVVDGTRSEVRRLIGEAARRDLIDGIVATLSTRGLEVDVS